MCNCHTTGRYWYFQCCGREPRHTHDCPLPMWERVLLNNSREQDELIKDMQALVTQMRRLGLEVEVKITEKVETIL